MKKWLIIAVILILAFVPEYSEAQCVMCKAVAEDSANSGGIGRGLNSGILYLMGIPYLLLTVLFFVFYRKKANFKG